MKKCGVLGVLLLSLAGQAQQVQVGKLKNDVFIRQLYADASYLSLKAKINDEFAHAKPGQWGEFVKGVDEDLVTNQKK